MKNRTLMAIFLVAALTIGAVGIASTATASPSKKKSCSACHSLRTAVKITLTRASSTATTATYRIRIIGGKGQAGWALFNGAKNIKHRTASTGTFTVTKGKAYKVWAVKNGTGSRYRLLTAR